MIKCMKKISWIWLAESNADFSKHSTKMRKHNAKTRNQNANIDFVNFFMYIIRIICFWYYSRIIIWLSLTFTVLEFIRTSMFFKKLKLQTPECSYALKNTLAKFKLNSKSYTAISRKVFGKSACDNPERYCGWFRVHCSSKNFERMALQAIDLCLRVLKERNKSRFDSYSVRNSVVIISDIAFRDYRVHIFPTTFFEIDDIMTHKKAPPYCVRLWYGIIKSLFSETEVIFSRETFQRRGAIRGWWSTG